MTASVKLFIAIFTGLAIIFVVLLVGVFPFVAKVRDLNVEAMEKKTELLNLEAQIQAYQLAQADLNKAGNRQQIIDAIVERENLAAAIELLERATQETKIDHVLSIQDYTAAAGSGRSSNPPPQVIDGKKAIDEVPYSLNMEGNYLSLVSFLRLLEHLPHFTEVTKINLYAETTSASREQTPVHSGQILGTIDGIFFVKKHENSTH